MPGPDILVQVHIPKCAGTSVSAWLRRAAETGTLSGFGSFYTDFVFDDDSLWQAGMSDPRLTAVSAHNIRRFRPRIGDRRIHYFTTLRHPLPHFLSIVRYMIQERDAYGIPAAVASSSRDVAAWLLDRPAGTLFRDNTQTNHLALYDWCDRQGGRLDPERYSEWDPADQAAYERERLGTAKAVLRSFLAVCIVERLADTLEVLRRRSAAHGLHLSPVDAVPYDNVTRVPHDDTSWIKHEPIGQRVLASLADDWELYKFTNMLYAESFNKEAAGFAERSG